MSIALTYRPTQSDLIHAARAWEAQHWKAMRYIVAAGLFLCGAYLLNLSCGWGAIFMLLGVLEAFNLMPAAVLRAVWEFRSNPKFQEEFHVTFTTESMHFITESIDSTLKWSMFSKVIETNKAFILVYGKRMYSVIPKRAMDSESKVLEFRELLSKVIGTQQGNA